jgi:predicted deacylase
MKLHFLFVLIILSFGTACQQTLVAVESSPVPSVTPLPPPTIRATQTPRQIDLPTSTAIPSPAPTVYSIITGPPLTLASPLVSPLDVNDASQATAAPTFSASVVAPENTFIIGQSVQGREIVAWRFGGGERILLLVGGIHAGFEANTIMLVNELVAHFGSTPADVLPGMTIILIPVANPDGLTVGRNAQGRFNANNVDLNRNWGCEWSPTAYWQDNRVSPGEQAFSEPETRAIGGLIRDLKPAAAIFYHSAAHGIFAGSCDGDHGSAALAVVIGEASGYPYGEAWSAYPVSGTAATWADGMGVPAVDLELSGTRETEFAPNLRGIMAVQAWLTGASS